MHMNYVQLKSEIQVHEHEHMTWSREFLLFLDWKQHYYRLKPNNN